jgi:hypothetical protein
MLAWEHFQRCSTNTAELIIDNKKPPSEIPMAVINSASLQDKINKSDPAEILHHRQYACARCGANFLYVTGLFDQMMYLLKFTAALTGGKL